MKEPAAADRLLARAIDGYRRGVVSLQRLSVLRGLPTEEVLGDLTSAGVHPPPAEPAWAVPESLPAPSLDLADLDALLEDESGQEDVIRGQARA